MNDKPTLEELNKLHTLLTKYTVSHLVDAVAYHSNQSKRQLAKRLKCHATVFTQWKNSEPRIMYRLRVLTKIPFED